MDATLVNVALGSYLAAAVVGGVRALDPRKGVTALFMACFGVAVASAAAAVAVRWAAAGRAPFSNMFESLVLFALSLGVFYLVVAVRRDERVVGFLAALLAAVVLGFASLLDPAIRPLMPALRSNWLVVHVLFCFIGYAAFGLAFASSLVFLGGRVLRPAWVGLERMDRITYRSIALGFLFLDVGILTGAVWANQTWGTYWSWDPKETWSLVTWLIYGVYLHGRYLRGWSRSALAWVSVGGFLAVIFTYVGVNYLLSGLHSYAG